MRKDLPVRTRGAGGLKGVGERTQTIKGKCKKK